jgi:hypothetical protein
MHIASKSVSSEVPVYVSIDLCFMQFLILLWLFQQETRKVLFSPNVKHGVFWNNTNQNSFISLAYKELCNLEFLLIWLVEVTSNKVDCPCTLSSNPTLDKVSMNLLRNIFWKCANVSSQLGDNHCIIHRNASLYLPYSHATKYFDR